MNTRSRTPRLEDVARLAGVSTATVSRALNAPARVGEETRERVTAAVAELGYSPNFGARALAAKRTMTVGAVIPTMENAIFARGLQAFQEGLRGAGYTLLVASSSYSEAEEEAQIRALVGRGADGLLLIGHQRRAEIRDFLALHEVPALVGWAWEPRAALPAAGFDNRAAMAEMTRAVIDAGHRRLAWISAHPAANDRALIRAEGLRAGMEAAGLDPTQLITAHADMTIEGGARAFAQVWERRPTAVLCGTDVLAVGAMGAAREAGLSVPGDVSITGFGDIDLARVTTPPLTTMHLPHRRMGREAARLLVAMIEGEEVGRGTRLDTEMRLRGTLGPPPPGDPA